MQITEERKKRVIDLYFNQHKSYAEIAEIEHISPRDIHAIIKEEEARRLQNKHQQQQEETSSRAYELFSKGKRPVEVAINLNQREPEATKLFIEYCKLKRLHKFYLAYKELGDNGIGYFVKLCKIAKKECWEIGKVVHALDFAGDKLPYMESLYRQAKDEVDKMQRTREETENYLHTLNDEIASSKELLQSYRISCQRKRQESEKLNNEISRLETLVNRFKSDDGEYLKIQKMVEEEVSKFLADGKVLLQFVLVSVIEAIRRNPDKYNNLLVRNSFSSSTAIISAQQSSSQPEHYDEEYNAMILEAADKLCSTLLKQLTSTIMNNTTAELKSSSSQSNLP